MKPWKKILIAALILLLLAIAGLFVWQGENIRALYKALTADTKTIAADLAQIRDEHHKAIEEEYDVILKVKPVTTEQSEELLDGTKTPEEVKQEMGYISSGALSNKDDIVAQCVAELYAYKADVMGYLGGLKQAAVQQWNALAPSERTKAKKAQIASAGLQQCYTYEAQVDGRVQEIIGIYREKILAIGESSAPIDILWNYYCDEKEAEKSYYFNKYLD